VFRGYLSRVKSQSTLNGYNASLRYCWRQYYPTVREAISCRKLPRQNLKSRLVANDILTLSNANQKLMQKSAKLKYFLFYLLSGDFVEIK